MKAFNFGMILGRFQGMHIGHVQMIEKALSTCEYVLVMVGSSQESFTVRNPFTCKMRMDIIRAAFPKELESGKLVLAHMDDMTNENDHTFEWGDYVMHRIQMWKNYFNVPGELDLLITGEEEDRKKWFRPEEVMKVNQLILSREQLPVSATMMRQFLIDDNWTEWVRWMPVYESAGARITFGDARELYDELREELMRIPHYQQLIKSKTKGVAKP